MKALIFTLLCLTGISSGQTAPPKADPQFKELNKAWGYLLGQRVLLESVASQHPELADQAKKIWAQINSGSLGAGVKGLEGKVAQKIGANFPEHKKKVLAVVRKKMSAKKYDRKTSEAIIGEVRKRLKGDFPPGTLALILSHNADFAAKPEAEMIAGWKMKYSSKANPAAGAAKFVMNYPASWVSDNAENSGLLERLVSGAGSGDLMAGIKVGPLPAKVPDAKMMEVLKVPTVKKMIPQGAKLLSQRNAVLGGQHAGMLIFDVPNPEYEGKVPIRTILLMTVKDRHMVGVQFMISPTPDEAGNLEARFKQCMPLFQSVVQSFKFEE